jgi:hypothetical protein
MGPQINSLKNAGKLKPIRPPDGAEWRVSGKKTRGNERQGRADHTVRRLSPEPRERSL